MSDARGRELVRKLQTTKDVGVATQLIHRGVLVESAEFVLAGLEGALGFLSNAELNNLLHVVSKEFSARKGQFADGFEDTKAFELHSPLFGKVTLGEFNDIIYGAVDQAINNQLEDNGYLSDEGSVQSTNRGYYSYGSYTYKSRTPAIKKANAKKAHEVFKDKAGDFYISTSSPIRIYAIHTAPTKAELERRKKEKELAKLEEKRAKQRQALQESEKQVSNLKEALAKAERRQKRIEKNMDK